MSGGDWIEDFTSGWGDPAGPLPVPPPPVGIARAAPVVPLACPRCQATELRLNKRTAVASFWVCGVCYYTWKEGPQVGVLRVIVA